MIKKTSELDQIIRRALEEDCASRDVTTMTLIDQSHRSQAVIVAKQEGIVCGLEIAKHVFKKFEPRIQVKSLVKDGDRIKKNQKIMTLRGSTRAILSCERVALNFLSYLSAIATKTKTFVQVIKPYKAQILDTRKTTPTLRFLERYAVRCGGGVNHRDNLAEMVLIKDNHLVAAGQTPLVQTVRSVGYKVDVAVEVEVDTLKQFKEILKCGADVILLDNMTPDQVRRAVELRRKAGVPILLEVSGGITLDNVRKYAASGVDRISIGGLTHSRQAIDFSLELI